MPDLIGYILAELLGRFFGWFRQYLDRPHPTWNEMTAWRKAMRLLLTVLGTTIFASPFIWFAWLLSQK